jgi:site-specific DNA-methyltransferase (adenine-specific)
METNKIYQGDCLELMKQLEDKSVDLILCDLPYGVMDSGWDKGIDLIKLWNEYRRIIKDLGVIVLFGNNIFSFKLVIPAIDLFKYKYVWIKTNSTMFVHSKNRPLVKHEDILIFSKASMGHKSLLGDKRMPYNPQDLIIYGKKIKKGNGRFGKYIGNRPSHQDEIVREFTNYPMDVLECQEDIGTTKLHTSQKPLELCEFLIKTYSSEGDLVLDNCIGSGTTAVACTNTKRNFIGIELSEEYCKLSEERIQKELSQVKLNTDGGEFFSSQP